MQPSPFENLSNTEKNAKRKTSHAFQGNEPTLHQTAYGMTTGKYTDEGKKFMTMHRPSLSHYQYGAASTKPTNYTFTDTKFLGGSRVVPLNSTMDGSQPGYARFVD